MTTTTTTVIISGSPWRPRWSATLLSAHWAVHNVSCRDEMGWDEEWECLFCITTSVCLSVRQGR